MKLINPEIRFEVTNKCNAKCIMCPRERMTRRQGVLDLNLYKKVLDEAVGGGAKLVSLENYGESFLDPYIFERAEYAKSKGLEVYTITNGSILDEKKAEKVADLFDKIRISMYGTTKLTYEGIHKGLSFEDVSKNVANLFETRRRENSKLRIEMYFLLMPENEHEMKDFLRRYEEIADGISVWKPHNWGDGRTYRPFDEKKTSCGRPFTGPVQVQWDGLAVPCCFDYDSKIVLGDFKKQTLHEVLHSKEYNAFRQAHQEGNFYKFPFCNVCDQLHKRDDVLVYTTIKNSKVGATNTAYYNLKKNAK
ncbi:MAG: SPASM domain-containing protein [Nitrospirae bacterium]|nr:SPASM domain-containing protein [Nitrospirota bacterium]